MTRWIVTIPIAITVNVLAVTAWAEYRAYELEVVDVYECRVQEKDPCDRNVVRTAMAPDLYSRTHGGDDRLGVLLLATWMCYGDTSNYRDICPRPSPRDGRFSAGDRVQVALDKHITNGWEGTVEVAYYQRSVNSNVYGVRFADRQNVYARYFEKDLEQLDGGGSAGSATDASAAGTPQREPPQ